VTAPLANAQILYDLPAAAEATCMGISTLRRALNATDPTKFPPPLSAVRDGKGRKLITRAELERWAQSLPPA
jgi:hypothetical protein